MNEFVDEILELFRECVEVFANCDRCERQKTSLVRIGSGFKTFVESEGFREGNHCFGANVLRMVKGYLVKIRKNALGIVDGFDQYRKVKIKYLVHKIEFLIEIMPVAYRQDLDGLSSLGKDHPRWQALRKITKTVNVDQEVLRQQTIKFMKLYNSAKAAIYINTTYGKSVFLNLLTASALVYNLFNAKSRKRLEFISNTKGSIQSLILLWNLTESSLLSIFLSLRFQSIHTSHKIYIPRITSNVLEDNIIKLPYSQVHPYSLIPISDHVGILLLSPFKLPSKTPIRTLFIHIHGGGNIGQSTFSHQIYTRRWSNSLNIPIFSIEYRLAPTNPFPEGSDDIWQAYVWLITQCSIQFGITPEKIILAGDSAGGCHIVSLALKAKQCGFRPPDSLLAIYPMLNQNPEKLTLGTFLSLEDPILNFHYLREIRKSYLKNFKCYSHILVSPFECDDYLIEDFPRIRFMVCLNDPLFMHSFNFADRLIRKKADVKLIEYPGFIHGAICFAHSLAIPIFRQFYEDSLEILQEFIDS